VVWIAQIGGLMPHDKISMVCIGAQKSATTTLHEILLQHPMIALPRHKEIDYFINAKKYGHENKLYEEFDHDSNTKVKMIINPNYSCHPHAIQRLHNYNPHLKIVFIIRNPIDRAISQYKLRVRNLDEKRSLHHVVISEMSKSTFKYPCTSILYRSDYLVQLQHLLQFFPRHQIYVMLFEDFVKDQNLHVNQLLKWLDLSEMDFEQIKANETHEVQLTPLWKLTRFIPLTIRMLVKDVISTQIYKDIKRLFSSSTPSVKMEDYTHRLLVQHFSKMIMPLETLTGLSLDVWNLSIMEKQDESQ
jgi:hypothetical protein